jgi:hypothetical protein
MELHSPLQAFAIQFVPHIHVLEFDLHS